MTEQSRETVGTAASGRAPLNSDAAVIAAIRHELWQASNGRGYGEDRTLVGMVRRVIAERDEARDNRRGEFELRMRVEAERDTLKAALQAAEQFIHVGVSRGPAVNGWQNTMNLVEAALAACVPPQETDR